jgi:hypothetical protein
MSNYTVLKPNETFKNKRYIDWIEEFSNWFYQPNLDRNNDGDVVFCRCIPLSRTTYVNEAVVMIGEQSLEISADQRVLFPIITANYVADRYETSDYLFGMVRSQIRQGGIPSKEQLLINGEPIDDGDEERSLKNYEFETSVFPITIPDCPPGVSLKDQMEIPLQTPGLFASVTRGFFVLLKLEANNEYIIESYASGATTEYGPYRTGSLYRIIVNDSSNQNFSSPKGTEPIHKYVPPSRLRYSIVSQLFEKNQKGKLNPAEFKSIKKYLKILDD